MREHVGRSIARLEDERFLTGNGRYTADFTEPGELHAWVLRSPHAHAIVRHIDLGAGLKTPGVHGIFTADDLLADGVGTLPCATVLDAVGPVAQPPRYPLARGRVRHVGDPIALIVAESAELAQSAAELVNVEYEELRPVVDPSEALTQGASQIWEEAPGNIAFRFEKGIAPQLTRHSRRQPTSPRSRSSTIE